jgi:hypothetical protein
MEVLGLTPWGRTGDTKDVVAPARSLADDCRFGPAKARGQALGNPRLDEARAIANPNHTAVADAFADSVAPAIRKAQAVGATSLRDIAALNGRGIATARSRNWDATSVANVLERLR